MIPEFGTSCTETEWEAAARSICSQNGMAAVSLTASPGSDHAVFLIDESLVLKIFHHERNCFEREKAALAFVAGRLNFATPEIVAAGSHDGLDYLIISRIPGRPRTRPEFLALADGEKARIVDELAAGFRELHSVDATGITDDWPQFVASQAESFIERQNSHGVNRGVVDALPQFLERNLRSVPLEPTVFLHGDVHFGNLRFADADGGPRVGGLFDFADSRRGFFEYDFLAVGVLMIQGQRDLQRRFFLEYGYAESDLNEEMRERLMMLTMLYETADLRRYALRLAPEAVDYPLDRLTREIWNFV